MKLSIAKSISWIASFTLLFNLSSTALAKVTVVTTLPSFADIAKNVGGDEVNAISLTRGNQDPHFVDAKPDLMLSLNKADLLIRAGLGLEDGWLPPLLTGSRNSKIQNGSAGNLDASSVMPLKDVPKTPLDRAQGDVHPGGNPHFMVDPRNGIILANAIVERLSKIEPSKAADFRKRADAFIADLKKHIEQWDKELKPFAGTTVVTYHKSWIYFLDWAHFKEAATVEPKPGIPPSPEHVVQLIDLMKKQKIKLILMEPFYPKGVAQDVAQQTGAKLLVLPVEVKGNSEAKTYIDVFDQIIKQVKTALTASHS
jgi:zinc/manganese transport system substrate-binding protein